MITSFLQFKLSCGRQDKILQKWSERIMVEVNTRVFGKIAVEDDKIIRFDLLSIFRISEQDAKAKLKCNCDSLITNLDVGFYFFLIYGKYFPVCKRKDRATENG